MMPEAGTQRSRQQSGARGGADEGEGLDIHGVGARRRALADNDVEFVVFQRRVADLRARAAGGALRR